MEDIDQLVGGPESFVRHYGAFAVANVPQAPRFISRSLSLLNGSQRKSHASRPRHTPPNRVWNGIFAAGDWPAKRGPKTTSPRGDRKSETTTRREMAAKTAFLLANYQSRVSEDWVVGAPGLEPGTR